MKLTANHADTCLPSHWGGHHLPHIQVMARKGMTLAELKADLLNELNNGPVLGSEAPDDEVWFDAARLAVQEITPAEGELGDATPLFLDLEEDDEEDGCESVYVFFVFTSDGAPLTDEQYVAKGGNCCPYCQKGNLEGRSIEIDGTSAYQQVSCLDCEETWTDTYRLDGYNPNI